MPKVSVLVPLYNTQLDHLKVMIESVLAQSYTDFELLILNDSPTNDALRDVVKSYTDSRIRYVENERNLGISASRNRLIDLAQGEYLAIFDHDDICEPHRLALEVAYLDEQPDVGVVSGQTIDIGNGRLSAFPENNADIKAGLMHGCVVAHPASMIRKSVLINNGIRYEPAFSPAEDYLLWIRLIGVTLFHNLKEPMIQYRNHEDNTSHRRHEKMADADLLIKGIAANAYPHLLPENTNRYWIKLFGVVPLLKVKRTSHKKTYSLFGMIPLVTITT